MYLKVEIVLAVLVRYLNKRSVGVLVCFFFLFYTPSPQMESFRQALLVYAVFVVCSGVSR